MLRLQGRHSQLRRDRTTLPAIPPASLPRTRSPTGPAVRTKTQQREMHRTPCRKMQVQSPSWLLIELHNFTLSPAAANRICSHDRPLLTAPHDVIGLLSAGELPALPGLCDVAQPVADASYRADSRPPLLPGDRRPLAARVAAARGDKHAPPAELLVSERAAASQVSPKEHDWRLRAQAFKCSVTCKPEQL